MKEFEHQCGRVLGHGLPDFPEDLKTFEERCAYQRGVADERFRASQVHFSYEELKEGDIVQKGDRVFCGDKLGWLEVGPILYGISVTSKCKIQRPLRSLSSEDVISEELLDSWRDALEILSWEDFGRLVAKFLHRKKQR